MMVETVLSTSNIEHCEGSTLRGISENKSLSSKYSTFSVVRHHHLQYPGTEQV